MSSEADATGLQAALLQAHAAGDGRALIGLYAEAAAAAADPEARAFFLTHAMVHALEAGDARAGPLRAALCEMGREVPL